jgi:hypothetical protein
MRLLFPTRPRALSASARPRSPSDAGFVDVRLDEEPAKGWICVVGAKPS